MDQTQQSRKNQRPTFAVLGVGAVGGLYGGMLARAGFEVHFLAKSDFQHLQSQGLHVETPSETFHLIPTVYNDVAKMPPVDCVIVSWKSTANDSLIRILPHFAASSPIVLFLQNGLDIEQSAVPLVGAENVAGGCCFLCANKVGPGRIKHLDYGRIAMGSYDIRLRGSIPVALQQVADAMQRAGIDVQLSDNLAQIRWKKLTWNIPYNGLSVVLNADTASIMADPHASKLVERLMDEVVQSALVCGITIGRDHVEKMLDDTRKMVPYASSMLLDYQAGRPMEIEAIFGNPLRAARSAGYNPSCIEMLYQQLNFLNSAPRAELESS